MKKYMHFIPQLISLLVLLFTASFAQGFAGERVKITGVWNGKYIEANRVQYRDGDKDPSSGLVKGRIDSVNAENLLIFVGPMQVRLSTETIRDNVTKADLSRGKTIKAQGMLLAPGLLLATVIESASSDGNDLQILGHVALDKAGKNKNLSFEILGIPVVVAQKTLMKASSLIRHPDDKRPDKQMRLSLLGKPLTVGGEIGTSSSFDGNFRLAETAEDDQLDLENAFQLELFYELSPGISMFVEGKTSRESVIYDEGGERETLFNLQRGQSWLFWGNIANGPLSLQIGRQNFREDREWWWDDDLDAIRVYYNTRRFHSELGFAVEIAPTSIEDKIIDPEEYGLLRLIGRTSWQWSGEHMLDIFYLGQHDVSEAYGPGTVIPAAWEDDEDATLLWFGSRLAGEIGLSAAGDLEYWIDGAGLTGTIHSTEFDDFSDADIRVEAISTVRQSGWAADAGLSWVSELPLGPTFTLGYAVGSGNRSTHADRNTGFRQTGLHDNNNKFSGVDRFRYYGELFRPELSNIDIFTSALGFNILKSSSIELVFHHYRQLYPDDKLEGKIKSDPFGEHPDIGKEIDIVLGLEEWGRVEIEAVGAFFTAGKAFGDLFERNAYHFNLKMDINF